MQEVKKKLIPPRYKRIGRVKIAESDGSANARIVKDPNRGISDNTDSSYVGLFIKIMKSTTVIIPIGTETLLSILGVGAGDSLTLPRSIRCSGTLDTRLP